METNSSSNTGRRRSRGQWRRKGTEGPIGRYAERASEVPFNGINVDACQGHQERARAPHGSFPISSRHTVRSVAQEAYGALWANEPDRAVRWHRVSNMDLVFGVGRPLVTFNNEVRERGIKDLEEMGMPEHAIRQHLANFADLMLWADGWGFVRWSRPTANANVKQP